MLSITKAAEELGVSRTKIYTLINKLGIETKKVSKENRISNEDFERIKKIVLSEQDEDEEIEETANERMKEVINRDRNNVYNNVSDREYTDLKERIKQLEKQIDKKDQQIQDQAGQIMESLKANSGLVESNKELNVINSNLNIMVYKTLNPPMNEISVDKEENEDNSWIRKIFKKKK